MRGIMRVDKRLKRLKPFILVGLIAVFVWATAAAMGRVSGWEQDIFRWAYDMPDSLRGFALTVTQLGSAWLLVALVGLLFVVRRNPKAAVVVLRNSVIGYVLVFFTKVLVARPRPDNLLEDITSREVFTYGQGFPSGHVALATIISLTVIVYLPKPWRLIAIPWILLVAWSRLYLGVHVPLDVLGGFVLGLIVIMGVEYLPKRLRA